MSAFGGSFSTYGGSGLQPDQKMLFAMDLCESCDKAISENREKMPVCPRVLETVFPGADLRILNGGQELFPGQISIPLDPKFLRSRLIQTYQITKTDSIEETLLRKWQNGIR